jgi:Holliday junction resolvasome RuvABC endonuclease subunit
MAIDPGSKNLGLAILDGEQILECQRINPESKYTKFVEKLNDILEKLYHEIQSLVVKYEVTHICWEITPAIGGMSHKDYVVSVGGMVKALAFQYGLTFQGVGATTCKKMIVGNYKATKPEVRARVLELYPTLKDDHGISWGQYDAYDAIIIALACQQRKDTWIKPKFAPSVERFW